MASASMLPAAAVAGIAALLAAEDYGVVPSVPRTALYAILAGAGFLSVAASGLFKKKASVPADALPVKLTGDEKKDFLVVFEALTAELLVDIEQYNLPERTIGYMKRLIEYNVPKGKLTRGLTVISALKSIKTGGEPLAADDYRRAATLGWCVEWLQAMFLVMDDIMDESETRRGQICWYLQPDVKMNAINDGLLLEAHIYTVLKKYFADDPALYIHLLELMHETTNQTALGQFLDLTTSEPDKVDFSRFSMQVYTDIVVYKTAWYSFYLPCALGMRLAGVSDPALYQQAKDICREMGTMFQVQDDYLDCYGDPDKIGKIGTDIRDNKCSWLVNRALQDATAAQKRTLELNYARKEAACEKKVKDVFRALNLEEKFKAYEAEAHASLVEKIANVKGMPTTIFSKLLSRIYQREK